MSAVRFESRKSKVLHRANLLGQESLLWIVSRTAAGRTSAASPCCGRICTDGKPGDLDHLVEKPCDPEGVFHGASRDEGRVNFNFLTFLGMRDESPVTAFSVERET